MFLKNTYEMKAIDNPCIFFFSKNEIVSRFEIAFMSDVILNIL